MKYGHVTGGDRGDKSDQWVAVVKKIAVLASGSTSGYKRVERDGDGVGRGSSSDRSVCVWSRRA